MLGSSEVNKKNAELVWGGGKYWVKEPFCLPDVY